jgi:hypothetical protein
MSATIIECLPDEQVTAWNTLSQWRNPKFLDRVGGQGPAARCPACNSIVYSRRHELCSVCGEHLPQKCRFTNWEARRVESLFETERSRHRAWLRKACTT